MDKSEELFKLKFGEGKTMVDVFRTCYLKDGSIDLRKMAEVFKKLEVKVLKSEDDKIRYDIAKKELFGDKSKSNEQDNPIIEKARELALIVDASRRNGNRSAFQNQIRMGKDFFMRRLAEHCLEPESIAAGLRVGIKEDENPNGPRSSSNVKSNFSLEVDIPLIGHLNWHFGREGNVIGFRRDMAEFLVERGLVNMDEASRTAFIERAKLSKSFLWYEPHVEPKIDKEGDKYSNINLLRGMKCDKVNDIDANLILEGVRNPEVELDENGDIKPVSRERLYGTKYIIDSIKKNKTRARSHWDTKR